MSKNIGSSFYLNGQGCQQKNGERFSKQTQISYLTEIFAVVARLCKGNWYVRVKYSRIN